MNHGESVIQDKVRVIRDFVTQRRVQDKLMKNGPLYSQMCTCMDTVSDTQQAIDAYKRNIDEGGQGNGDLYLQLYGLLQVIFVQQDSTIDMSRALEITDDLTNYPKLLEIRMIRNQSTGHPTNYRQGESFNAIVQHNLSKHSFEFFSYGSQGSFTTRTVELLPLIQDQETYIGKVLDKITSELQRRDTEHKTQFEQVKLADCFMKSSVFYCCEKMMEALLNSSGRSIAFPGDYGVRGIKSTLDDFKQKLQDRGLKVTTYPGIQLAFEDCSYPIEQLLEYFRCIEEGQEPGISKQTAIIFGEYLSDKVSELHEMAQEVDKEYSLTQAPQP